VASREIQRMRVLLVHHADAVGPDVDPQRPLSALGRRQADEMAKAAAAIGFAPAAIWHSGKLRSRETAEAFLRACAPFAQFKMIRGLQPDDPPEWLRDELAAEVRDVLLVGHMPNIARLTALLSGGAASMPLHGTIGFEKSGDGYWTIFSELNRPARS
jgi:phosphohistidine phosphatase